MPRFISGWENHAFAEAILIWQAMASSLPPPMHAPLTAAITGMSKDLIIFINSCPFFANASPSLLVLIAASSFISAPAQKVLPAPVLIIALIFPFLLKVRKAAFSLAINSRESVLTGGLLIVSVARLFSICVSSNPFIMIIPPRCNIAKERQAVNPCCKIAIKSPTILPQHHSPQADGVGVYKDYHMVYFSLDNTIYCGIVEPYPQYMLYLSLKTSTYKLQCQMPNCTKNNY